MTGWLAMRPMHLRAFALGMSVSAAALAQVEQGIYTCIDGKGRRLTSDRPIAECNDREQQQLNPSGTVRRRITPPPTAQELAAQEERARREAEERARVAEEKRRDRALLIRYPNKETHDRERVASFRQVDEVIAAAQRRIVELTTQRKKLDTEMEFYIKDPSKAPATLRRQVDENTHSMQAQQRFISDQEQEKRRIAGRFDEELAKLRQLWQLAAAPAQTATPSAAMR